MRWRDFEEAVGGKLRDILDYEGGEAMERAADEKLGGGVGDVTWYTWGVERAGCLLVVAWLLRGDADGPDLARFPNEIPDGDALSIGFVVVDVKPPGAWRRSGEADERAFEQEYRYHEAASRAAAAKRGEG